MPTLVIAEHDAGRIRAGSLSALSAAAEIATDSDAFIELLVLGAGLDGVAAEASRFAPVLVADHPALGRPTADRYAHVIGEVARARGAETIVAASTTFSRDILPRAAALLNAAMAGDVIEFVRTNGELLFRRPVYAGAATALVALSGDVRVVTVRPSAFSQAAPAASPRPVTKWTVDVDHLPDRVEYIGLESRPTNRPELTEAQVVVSGGRALKSSDEFERYIGGLADTLNGATGCTRALVDAGVTPNEWQVGQTGKAVAPQLYFAIGVSGAIQHIAGMKGSKVVVAINSDPEAPIFGMAHYGLVGDLRDVVPRLIEQLRMPG